MNHDVKFQLQSEEYVFPYHHLIDFENINFSKSWAYGIEYYFYSSEILNLLKNKSFQSIADIGCGDGKIALEIARLYNNKIIYGFDIESRSINFAKSFNCNTKNVYFYNEDFNNFKFNFDIIVLNEVLEHIPQDEIKIFVKNCFDKLNKYGEIIISVPSLNIKNIPEKHYKHYEESELFKDVGEYFDIKELKFVYKKNLLITIIEKLLLNKIFCIIDKKLIKIAVTILKNLQKSTNKKNGRHIIAVLRKKD